MSCDVGEVTSQLILCSLSNLSVTSPTSQLIFQPFRRFTYVTAHSPTLLSLLLRLSPFSNPSFASPTSHLILQPFFRFSYVTGSSLTSPGEPPMRFGQIFLIQTSRACREDWVDNFWIGTLVRKLTVFMLQVQQVQIKRLNLTHLPEFKVVVIYWFMTPLITFTQTNIHWFN